ncbi:MULTISPECIES: hypothetical protein [Salinibaculum]|uniref:hypothetical protein n=1 Tax=Salinibaculum TaxID=2732368 RepID=UPI0030D3DBC6
MSAESSGGSRPPQTNSANAGSGSETAEHESRSKSLCELPSPQEKVREFLDGFGERAHVPLSTEHGRSLRPECVEQEYKEYTTVTDDGEEVTREEEVSATAVPLWQAVGEMLEWHEQYHESTLRLEYGIESDPTHTLLDVDLENSWFAAYQDKERARLKALERETCGFETCDECDTRYCSEPDEHETEYVSGAFEEPVVVLTGRTASGAGRPPVDHARAIADAWSDGVRRSLRYVMDKLGLESSEWVRWSQGEPHPGDGENRGYHHAHDIIILDGAAAEGDVTAATFREVIETHVSECQYAGPKAHDLNKSREEWASGDVDTVAVKHVDGEIEESVASYAAAYLANEKVDLLERPPEYLAWAATMWATGTRKATGTDSRTHAIEADKCRHKHATGEQDVAHGEQVTYSTRRGYKVECAMCGSPWEVEQAETVVAAKRTAGPEVAADGGAVPGRETAEQQAEEELRDRWPSARAVASVGGETAERECHHKEPDTCPLCATETESPNHTVSGEVPIPESASAETETVQVGFERPPSWSAKCIIRDGEELPASGGTTEKVELNLPSAPTRVVAMATRGGAKAVCQECGAWCDSPKEYVEHGCEGRVYVGWLPATEPPAEESGMSYREFCEAVPEHLLTESSSGGDLDSEGSEPQLGESVRRYCENNSPTVPEVLGRFGLSPERRGEVEKLV